MSRFINVTHNGEVICTLDNNMMTQTEELGNRMNFWIAIFCTILCFMVTIISIFGRFKGDFNKFILNIAFLSFIYPVNEHIINKTIYLWYIRPYVSDEVDALYFYVYRKLDRQTGGKIVLDYSIS